MSYIRFFLIFIILISCTHSFIILNPAHYTNQCSSDYFDTLADGSMILIHSDDEPNPLTFIILDADGTIIRSLKKPDAYSFPAHSVLALKNGNFVFVLRTEIKTIVFEIYDKFFNLMKETTTVKYSDESTNDITSDNFLPFVFRLNNNGFGIIYLRDESTQYINFYDQDGNFISTSPERFPYSTNYFHAEALQMPDDNILFIAPSTRNVADWQFSMSLKSNGVEQCSQEYFDCCGHQIDLLNIKKIKRMKNGMAVIAWVRRDIYTIEPYVTSAAYFTIFDASCTKKISEIKIGDTQTEPQIECLENGYCVFIYTTNYPSPIYNMILRIFDTKTKTLGPEIIVFNMDTMDPIISGYSNSNFMMVWTDWNTKSIVGRVYSLDCLEYVGEECQSCANPKVFSKGKLACVTPIGGCEEYSANGKCITCKNQKKPIEEGLACRKTIIKGCASYSEDNKCVACKSSKVLSVKKTACVEPIQQCNKYKKNGKCLACDNDNILSTNKMKCFPVIFGCIEYSSNSKCKSCIHGTKLSSDKRSCSKIKKVI